MSGLVLACLALASLAGGVFIWMRLIQRVEIDEGRRLPQVMIVSGLVLAIVALTQSPGVIGGILAGVTAAAGALAVLLRVLAPQSSQAPAVAVGSPLPGFSALDDSGAKFELSDLDGRPVLIKFFRGHW
jgi:hypothetical protein